MNDKESSATYTLRIDDDKLDALIKEQKDELPKKIKEFNEKYKEVKTDKFANNENVTNPYLVSTYFFKTLNPSIIAIPVYNAIQLTKVWSLYMEIVEKVNMEVMMFQPTLTHFASFSGLSLERLQALRTNTNESMRNIANRIYDETFDANMTLTQHKRLTEKSTTYRMKVENEAIEKKSPNVNINMNSKDIDLVAMKERLKEIKAITKNQIEYEGK